MEEMCEARCYNDLFVSWETKRIIIFKLRSDPMDISALEKDCRVNKTGIVESDFSRA